MTKFEQLRERYPNLIPIPELRANVSIIELALHWGYELRPRKGKNRPVLENTQYNDKIIIKNPQNAAQQVYQQSGNFTDAGTIIDFIRNRLNTVFSAYNRSGEHLLTNITKVLYDYLSIDPTLLKQTKGVTDSFTQSCAKKPFDISRFDLRPLEQNSYLIKRHITSETVARPEFSGKIVTQVAYFDSVTRQAVDWATVKAEPTRTFVQFTNVAFPYYDGLSTDVTGLEVRNLNVKLHATGSDRSKSVFITNPPPRTSRFYILESVIDVLAHRQLRSMRGDDNFDSVYFSTGGQLTPQQVQTLLRYISALNKSTDFTIRLAFDNDAKGCEYDLLFVQQLVNHRFQLTPAKAGTGQLAFRLPNQIQHKFMISALQERIFLFNRETPESENILINQVEDQLHLSVPQTTSALSILCSNLVTICGLEERVIVEKAKGKDFNEDLTSAVI